MKESPREPTFIVGLGGTGNHVSRRLKELLSDLGAQQSEAGTEVIDTGSEEPPRFATDAAMPTQTSFEWDAFMSHASEDKDSVARPLADKLASGGLRVWLDEAELRLGDSLRGRIDEGLSRSRYGIVILSPNFFGKNWPRSELDGLVARESGNKKFILPVWHKVGVDEVTQYSPILAGRFSVSTALGLDEVSKKILAAVYSGGRTRSTGRPIHVGKLTKQALFEMPTGSVLINNSVNPVDRTPSMMEEIGNQETREALWVRLRSRRVTGRKCYVFSDMANAREHLAQRLQWDTE